jgi:hypothetical protein
MSYTEFALKFAHLAVLGKNLAEGASGLEWALGQVRLWKSNSASASLR